MDRRDKDQFKQDLLKYHKIEEIWSQIIVFDLNKKGIFSNVIPYGSDSKGEILPNKKVTSLPDYVYIFDGNKEDILVEMKAHRKIEECDFCTYKVSSIKSCIKNNAYIYTPHKNGCYIFNPKTLSKMLDTLEHKKYYGFGNKLAIRITKDMLNSWVDLGIMKNISWHEKTKELIKSQNDRLFK